MSPAKHPNSSLHKHLLKLMNEEEATELLETYKLRRSLSPLHIWRESTGTAINIHETGVSGIMRPLGSIRISKHGHLVIQHAYPAVSKQYEKLYRFANELAHGNNLTTEHLGFRNRR